MELPANDVRSGRHKEEWEEKLRRGKTDETDRRCVGKEKQDYVFIAENKENKEESPMK